MVPLVRFGDYVHIFCGVSLFLTDYIKISYSFMMVILILFLPSTAYENEGCAVVSHAHVGPEAATIIFLYSLLSSSVFRRPFSAMMA